jgi:hypothetical protein
MASDIVLVLGTEHRDLRILADQCGRLSRGFHDPVAGLRRRLQAHVAAADLEVFPALSRSSSPPNLANLVNAVELVGAALGDASVAREELAKVAWGLVEAERSDVLSALATQLPIAERRRMGKVFRMRRDAVMRAVHARHNRQRSQTELYELARRAGLKHRSTMTQAQLQAAVAEWEDRHGHGIQATG